MNNEIKVDGMTFSELSPLLRYFGDNVDVILDTSDEARPTVKKILFATEKDKYLFISLMERKGRREVANAK